MVGGLSVELGVMMSETGPTCAKSMKGSTSEAVKGVLSRSRSGMWWKSDAQDALLVLVLVLSLSSRVEPALVSKLLLPGSYTSMPLSLLLKSMGLPEPEWLLRLRLLLSRLEASSVLTLLLLGSCALLLKSLGSNARLKFLPLSSLLPVLLSLSSCAVLLSTLLSGWLRLLLGTCAGSGFATGVTSLFLTLDISACSCIWRLFGLCFGGFGRIWRCGGD